ncbi:ABC-type dipeptide/oligopeptide/nickel transport system, permease component [Schinkia azotoformans MEV2011]|uniref:ABC-type dipeptide/oligopeptide/nickel transport system, permease component n=1 Tax=Schinkia azotoformans MEV2011 TaxID=1348973 RepID=A0A072NHW3_SCHAZ|nr:nickel/cobalt ABC transporter permease [Schinkia azotoformans]KEF37289.1 ABC-type dipeptide/oligopeptide/nickel transport system, permease component [Schinkia azotoformans MEV2011]MEC1697547.1 ABC transporter permease subunit [Schinkia azotoformans]MEC1718474.1 ABC transporter permease subunit [Schinkia azotoformans]MEC1727385.1 ABC transporter permease subunit [Schinkia azotoformans]MEC1743654.1 ABC transporter permease subunit [Schinkia azotoformans]
MNRYILNRMLGIVPIVIGISFLSFVLINLNPSDPAEVALRVNDVIATEQAVAEMRLELGLDKPFMERYLDWIFGSFHGDFGTSFITKEPVLAEMKNAIAATLLLVAVALIMIMVVSITVSIFCVIYENSIGDRLIRAVVFIGEAMPSFWIGILLIWFFSVKLGLFPIGGMETPSSVVLPALTLSLGYISMYVRLIRNNMVQNKSESYVFYARVRGLKKRVILKHILKNSLLSTITAIGMSIPKLIAGAVVVENIFAWPGVGRLCVTAIFNHDYPIIQAYILIMAVLFVVFNLLVDIITAFVDPRVRKGA